MISFDVNQDADELYRKHQEVSAQLEAKYNETRLARERAAELKERATEMYTSTKTKVDRLSGQSAGGSDGSRRRSQAETVAAAR